MVGNVNSPFDFVTIIVRYFADNFAVGVEGVNAETCSLQRNTKWQYRNHVHSMRKVLTQRLIKPPFLKPPAGIGSTPGISGPMYHSSGLASGECSSVRFSYAV